MEKQWTQETVQKYIDEQVEESLTLEYKGAEALGKSDSKKRESIKDVSAMSNSDGGIIIYGVMEYQESERKHLPEKIDPVNQTEFSKEWLEQVINNIRPRIDGVVIHPVPIDAAPNHVVYVVEVPQSTTAHQAKDYRYYKRFNFESVPMEDYEVRDVMHRVTTPDVQAEFSYIPIKISSHLHRYKLAIVVRNQGIQVVKHFKLQFTFPGFIKVPSRSSAESGAANLARLNPGVSVNTDNHSNFLIIYRSQDVLFPQDEVDVGRAIDWEYHFDDEVYRMTRLRQGDEMSLNWILYADDMTPKRGKILVSEVNKY